VAWWHDMGIEPLEVARRLWGETRPHASREPATASVRPGDH
jgi:hypothetical protein